jgi:D-glycero-alpha-D-manno-heptose-7-phosphate kinase
VSFLGGGSDLAAYYKREQGMVVSTAIDKYVYIALHDKFDGKIALNYSSHESVDSVDEVKHPILREALRLTGVSKAVEINSMADIPSEGSGLGGSSSFSVGVLNALHAFKGEQVSPEQLAQEACKIEIDLLGEPIGKQDQYIAAYGGLRTIKFNTDDTVSVNNVSCSSSCKRDLEDQLLMFYTGITRKASAILSQQKENTASKSDAFGSLTSMVGFARQLETDLSEGDSSTLGTLLGKAWEEKKKLAAGVSNPEIDRMYQTAINAGATGGKILGAGGGGFLLVYCPREKIGAVRKALSNYREMLFRFEPHGSIAQRL